MINIFTCLFFFLELLLLLLLLLMVVVVMMPPPNPCTPCACPRAIQPLHRSHAAAPGADLVSTLGSAMAILRSL